jgi:predicted TIM-barrel fold metal-dependent hydrolase
LNIPIEEYLAHALRFKPEEETLRDSFAEWLPDDIIDCHAHSNLKEHVVDIAEKARAHMLSSFPYYSIADSRRVCSSFFHPGKRVRTLRFAKTFRGLDHRAANDYLLEESPKHDRVALFGLPEDIDYTASMLNHPRASALKMYYFYVEPTAKTIYEVFKPEILEEAQRLDKPIILHMPKMIVHSAADLERVLDDFPRLRVSIAHLGSTKFAVDGLREVYANLASRKNVSLDTSLNPSREVVRMALECFGSERIMYGSDEPLHLLRSIPFNHPEKGQRIITDYPYHWVDAADHAKYGHLASNAVHAHWLALGAVRNAIESLPKSQQENAKHRIFFKNASDFFGF